MPEEDLDGPQIDAGLKQVGGEAMAEHVNAAALADAGLRLGPIKHFAGAIVIQGLAVTVGKQPGSWPIDQPVGTQLFEQPVG
jgi:hypothetical protein